MNITFFIGNGFDRGLGLETSYEEFYRYFVKEVKDGNVIKKQIENYMNNDICENWSDLEKALGNYTDKMTTQELDKFLNSKEELDEILLDYLVQEEKKIDLEGIEEDILKNDVISALESIRSGTNEKEKAKINSTLRAYQSQQYNYYAINFNYTRCLDDIFNIVRKKSFVIGAHSSQNGRYQEVLVDVIHVHGTVDDGEMILGVNDEAQIKNSEFASNSEVKLSMIKPYANDIIGQNKINKVTNILDESGIICIYGMSLGDTDKMWWEYIGKWLKSNKNRILMIFAYDKNYRGKLYKHKINFQQKVKQDFCLKAGSIEAEAVESQIIVYINNNIWEIESLRQKDNLVG